METTNKAIIDGILPKLLQFEGSRKGITDLSVIKLSEPEIVYRIKRFFGNRKHEAKKNSENTAEELQEIALETKIMQRKRRVSGGYNLMY